MDRLKIEEEKREAARQARKLEFLISQTELYSHFVGSKLKSKRTLSRSILTSTFVLQPQSSRVTANLLLSQPGFNLLMGRTMAPFLRSISMTVSILVTIAVTFGPTSSAEDNTNLHRHAMQNAQEAIALAKQRAEQFDAQAAIERKTNEALKLAKSQSRVHEDSLEEGQTDEAPLEPSNSHEPKSQLVDCKLPARLRFLFF
jgi:DNA helicase INO80